MAQPMLSVAPEKGSPSTAKVHLLPCRIHHDGSVDPVEHHWAPNTDSAGRSVAYLRGRKLHGRTLKLPEGYRGSVLEKGTAQVGESRRDGSLDDIEVAEDEQEVQIQTVPMQPTAQFEELVIWGHESTAGSSEDPYVRGMEEWISFAEQVHAYGDDSATART